MNVLINADEWLMPWARQFIIDDLKKQSWTINWANTSQYVKACKQEFRNTGLITVDFNNVNYLLMQDLREFRNLINDKYKTTFKQQKSKALDRVKLLGLSDNEIVNRYLNDATQGFAKDIAPQLSDNIQWMLNVSDADWGQPFFIRNIINNEDLLKRCLEEHLEFWFVDSGYTNFLEEKNKKWHRLVKNHIHHCPQLKTFPTDRIDMFSKLPKDWRRKGSKILVVEGSPMHYKMRGTSIEEWRNTITQELGKHTGREIEFRPKSADRKTRRSVYELLRETKDYYCVISDSSAAAVEAIWTGTPAITLEQHITNPVSRNKLSQINDLYRADIEPWLAMLSYSQYTYEELCNGTAVAIVKEYFDA